MPHLLAWTAIGVCVVGCGRKPDPTGRLVVAPGARDVQAVSEDEREELQYRVGEAYPATKTIEAIGAQLRDRGWRPVDVDFLNPGTPTSHRRGWGGILDSSETPQQRVDAWSGDWTNVDGDNVRYLLAYRRGVDQQRPATVEVVALYWSARLIARIKGDIAKRPGREGEAGR